MEKSIHSVTEQLRQNMASQNIATIKKLSLLSSNVSELFQEILYNRKLLRDYSQNITKQVNVLRQKQMELHYRNNIVQQNLTELFNETVMINRKMELIQQKESTLYKMIRQEKIERENITKQLTFEIANQNISVSYIPEESTGLTMRVELLQQNVTSMNKMILAERFQRGRNVNNVTKQLRLLAS